MASRFGSLDLFRTAQTICTLWDVESGEYLRSMELDSWLPSLVFASEQQLLARSLGGAVEVWDLRDGRCLRALASENDHLECCVVFSGGHRALSGSQHGILTVWDVDTGESLRRMRAGKEPITWCAVQGDAPRALSISGCTLQVWDLRTGECLRNLEGRRILARCASYPDGRRALTCSGNGFLELWDLTEGGKPLLIGRDHGSPRHCIVYDDGRRASTLSSGSAVQIWNLSSNEPLLRLGGERAHMRCCAVHPDSRRVLTGTAEGTLTLWDSTSGEMIKTFDGPEPGSSVMDCAFLQDGRLCLSTGSKPDRLRNDSDGFDLMD